MYRRILVPVDGSAISTLGLRHAIALAKSQKARLRVLNVLDEKSLVNVLAGYPEVDVKGLLAGMRTAGRDAAEEAAALASKSGVKPDPRAGGRPRPPGIGCHRRRREEMACWPSHGHAWAPRLQSTADGQRCRACAE